MKLPKIIKDLDFLRQKSILVESKQEGLDICKTLVKVLQKHNKEKLSNLGIGLSAIQIGIPKRVFVTLWNNIPQFFINPKLVSRSNLTFESEEGCLSIPNFYKKILRYTWIDVQCSWWSESKKFGQDDLEVLSMVNNTKLIQAAIVQHELDHLEGKIIAD